MAILIDRSKYRYHPHIWYHFLIFIRQFWNILTLCYNWMCLRFEIITKYIKFIFILDLRGFDNGKEELVAIQYSRKSILIHFMLNIIILQKLLEYQGMFVLYFWIYFVYFQKSSSFIYKCKLLNLFVTNNDNEKLALAKVRYHLWINHFLLICYDLEVFLQLF